MKLKIDFDRTIEEDSRSLQQLDMLFMFCSDAFEDIFPRLIRGMFLREGGCTVMIGLIELIASVGIRLLFERIL